MAAICAALSEELCVVAGDEVDARTTGLELLLMGAGFAGTATDLTGAGACFC